MATREYAAEHLMADLRGLVEAGLLVEIRAPGEPSRYGLSALGERIAIGDSGSGHDPSGRQTPAGPEP
jgi:hypothetical protein